MFVGLDLAGSEKQVTGICLLSDDNCSVSSVHTDREIINTLEEHGDSIRCICIDAPLSYHGEAFRDGDRELRKHCPILPLTFKGMQMLSNRGMHLAEKLRKYGEVIEVYPHASKKFLHIKGAEELRSFGLEIQAGNEHEFDAAICALTAKFYCNDRYIAFGVRDKIIVPIPE